jgi:hypothetical protein
MILVILGKWFYSIVLSLTDSQRRSSSRLVCIVEELNKRLVASLHSALAEVLISAHQYVGR